MNENNNNNNRRRIRRQLRDVDYDDDDDDELEYGLRRTCRRTSYEHRGTSALSPAQVIDRDTYYEYASIALMQSMYIYQLLLYHLVMYRYLQRCISNNINIKNYSLMLLLSSLDDIARGTRSAVYAASRRVLGDELQLPRPCVILIDLLHQQLDDGTPLFLRLHQCCNLSFQDQASLAKCSSMRPSLLSGHPTDVLLAKLLAIDGVTERWDSILAILHCLFCRVFLDR